MTLQLQPLQSKKIPGPSGLPLVGNMLSIGKHPHASFNKLAKEYGEVFQVCMGARTIVVLNGLETIREAALKQQEEFASRPDLYLLQNALLGQNMGGRMYDERWMKHREIATHAIHQFLFDTKNSLEQTIMQEATELANVFLSYGNQPFDPEIDIGIACANVMFAILFKERSSRDEEDLVKFVKNIGDFISNSPGTLKYDVLPPLIRPLANIVDQGRLQRLNDIMGLLGKIVMKRLERHQNSYNPENVRGMADALIKATSKLDESEKQALDLSDECIVEGTSKEMVGSATEPSSTLLRWALLYMIGYPEIQDELHQELDAVLGKNQQLRYEDRKKLPFTEACIHECLRYAPAFPLGLPHATTTDTTINGYFIPKNTCVVFNLYGLGQDERYWKEPEKFNPRRFLDKNGEFRDDLLDKFYPFGLGKRRCFGEYLARLELFIFFSSVMHKFKFERVPGEKLNFDGKPGVTVPPENYKVIAKPRF